MRLLQQHRLGDRGSSPGAAADMNGFVYERAIDAEDGLKKGALPGAEFLGGGTSLLDLMKLRVEMPRSLVDLNHAGMNEIEIISGGLRIGALATMSQVASHSHVRDNFPLLRQALLAGASPQLRNAATIGGNLRQRPRCFYFRESGFRCNKRVPGSGCDALFGDNESHAVFGTSSECIAVNPSDLATALVSLEATVETRMADARRRIAIADFFVRPEEDARRETVIEPGELIVAIEIEAGPRTRNAAYVKVPPAGGFAIVSAAVSLDLEDGLVKSARVAMGGVAHIPWRAHFAEERLTGRRAKMSAARGRGKNDYKIALGREVLAAALGQAAGAAQ